MLQNKGASSMIRTLRYFATLFLITSITTPHLFAAKANGYKTLAQQREIETKAKNGTLPSILEGSGQEQKSNKIKVEDLKPYNGFIGVKKTKVQNIPNTTSGDVIRLIQAIESSVGLERQVAVDKLNASLQELDYQSLSSLHKLTESPLLEQHLYNAWLNTDRSASLIRSHSGSESEPNNSSSTASTLHDTTKAYLTAFDEDWYTFTTTGATDMVIETAAGSGVDNVGDTKLYLYGNPDSTYLAYNDDSNGGYSKITYRTYAAGTYYVKVVAYSASYIGAYTISYNSTPFSDQYNNVVINEIHYNPSDDQGPDSTFEFLEIYNNSLNQISLSGWTLSSGSYSVNLSGNSIDANGYVIVVDDELAYTDLSATVISAGGYFGLSNSGASFDLKDSLGRLVNEVSYSISLGWDITDSDGDGASGGGLSLELTDPALDNSDPSNWTVSGVDGGTPGAANSSESDIMLASSNIVSYQATGSTSSSSLQIKNMGLSDLVVDSAIVTEYLDPVTYLSEGFESWPPTGWTLSPATGLGAWAQDAGTDYGPNTVTEGSSAAYFNVYDFSSGTVGSMTTPSVDLTSANNPSLNLDYWNSSGSDRVVISVTTDGTNFTNIDTLLFYSSWTTITVDLSAYIGEDSVSVKLSCTSDYGVNNPHIDNFSISEPPAAITPNWISVTTPSTILPNDSANLSISFSAATITSNADKQATINVYSNDPNDAMESFTASMVVRADTAIMTLSNDIMPGLNGFTVIGDTSAGATSLITNLGGDTLVLDSATFSAGASSIFFTDIVPGSKVDPVTGSLSFSVNSFATASGSYYDTLTVHANTDSSNRLKIGYQDHYVDTTVNVLYDFVGTDGADGWTISNGVYVSSHSSSGYVNSLDGSLVSPRTLFTGSDVISLSLSNADNEPVNVEVYFSSDKEAASWTGWTAVDTLVLEASSTLGTSSTKIYGITLPSSADTGYVGLQFVSPGTPQYYTRLNDIVLPKSTPEPVVDDGDGGPVMYTTESFESWPPAGWTFLDMSAGQAGIGAEQSTAYSNNGSASAYFNDYQYSQNAWMITPAMNLSGYVDPTISYFEYNRYTSYYNFHQVAISTDMETWIQLATGVGPTSWTEKTIDLSDYVGQTVYVGFNYIGNWADEWLIDDVRLPYVPPLESELSVSANSINFNALIYDSLTTGSESREVSLTIANDGIADLVGAFELGGQGSFTLSSSDSINLSPDSSLNLSVIYHPNSLGVSQDTLAITTNGGNAMVALEGHSYKGDLIHDFEYGSSLESLGYESYNYSGGVYWGEVTGTNSEPIGGNNFLQVASHEYGGQTMIVLPKVTVDADGERIVFDAKVNITSPQKASTLYVLKLTDNGYSSYTTADTLGKFTVGDPNGISDFTTSWANYFQDYYGIAQGDTYIGLLYEDKSTSFAGAATLHIDNIRFVDAPTVPIVSLNDFSQEVSMLADAFNFSNYSIGRNTGGDTLFISSIASSDSNMTVSAVSDTVLKGDDILLNFSLPASVLHMGHYHHKISMVHNDTIFSGGSSEYVIKTDFTHDMISFEDGTWPNALMAMDYDEDGMTWQVGPNSSMDGSYAIYSNKEPSTPIGENMVTTQLRRIGAGDMLIFHANYTSHNDPQFMHVMVSEDFGGTWTGIDTVESPDGRYEYHLDQYSGHDIMLGIMDVNYGNSADDRLYVDRLLLPAPTSMQAITSIRGMDSADSTYSNIGDTVLVSGIVTVADEFSSVVVFQDSLAGLAAYSSDLRGDVSVGDKIIVRGELKTYKSLLQLNPVLGYLVVDSDLSVAPVKVTVGDLEDGVNVDALESMLVSVENVTIVDTSDWGSGSSGFNLDIESSGDTATVRVDRDTEIYDSELPYGPMNLVGVVQQYDYQDDPYEGYQLMPRYLNDIELMARYSGTVVNASTGSGIAGVSIVSDIDSTGSDQDGNYSLNTSLDADVLNFSKTNYTDAFFSINGSEAGFHVIDVDLYPSAPVGVYSTGFESASDTGNVDLSVAEGTQWAVVDSVVLADTVIYPFAGSKFLSTMDSAAYQSDSYSFWTAPRQLNLSSYNTASIKMHAWTDAESCCDEVSVMLKSASDSTGDWTVLGEITGRNLDSGWEEYSFSLNFLDLELSNDMQLALLFESDGSVQYTGIAIDQVLLDGADVFAAAPPVNLMATDFEDSQVTLHWGVPGSDTAMVQMEVVNPTEFIDAEAIVSGIIESDPSMAGLTVDQWIADRRAEDPKFNLHPRPRNVLVPYISNTPASRALTHYNIFREEINGDDGWSLFDSTSSLEYIDEDVINYEGYRYTVSAVYEEGESFETPEVVSVPGYIEPHHVPIMSDFNMVPGSDFSDGWGFDPLQQNNGNDWSIDISEAAEEEYLVNIPEHGIFAFVSGFGDENELTESVLLTPHFSAMEHLPAVYLTFDSYASSATTNYRDVVVRYGYGPWEVVASIDLSSTWEEQFIDVTEEVNGHHMVQFGFRFDENISYYNGVWAIDNVKIGIEPGPNNLVALPGAGEIHLHWGQGLDPENDPGGRSVNQDESGRSQFLTAPVCDNCETNITRIEGQLFKATFDYDEPTQFVEYNAVTDSTSELTGSSLSPVNTNWLSGTYTDVDGSGDFNEGDQSWVRFYYSPTATNFDHWIISDAFDATGDSMFFMFDEYLDDYTGAGDTVAAHISTDGGLTWTTVWEMADQSLSTPSGPAGYWNRHLLNAGMGSAQTHIAFSMRGTTTFNIDNWHVDNVFVLDHRPPEFVNIYNVLRDGEVIAENLEMTTFVDDSVVFGQVYCYQIQPVRLPFPDGEETLTNLSNRACSSPCNVPPPPAMLATPSDSSMIVLIQDPNGVIVDTEGNSSLEFSWIQAPDHDGQEISNAFMLHDQLQSLAALLEVPVGVTTVSIPYEELVVQMTNAGEEEISGSWGIWTADSIDNSCCWAQAMSAMNQLTVNISQALKVDNSFIPDVFALHQNYPNPFNPVTNIVYDIPEASDVRITIYNVTGQKVRTLLHKQHNPGRYRIMWSGVNDFGQPVSSGMYFYRIMASDFVSVKKLILMK